VPVKILSTALFLLSLFLLLPNIRILYTFFVLGKTAELQTIPKPIFRKSWINKSLIGLKIIIIAFYFISQFFLLKSRLVMISEIYKKSSINGVFKVDLQGKSLKTIPSHWRYIIFEFEGNAVVRDTDYKADYKEYVLDEKTKEITINNFKLHYLIQENGDIILTKTFPTGTEEIKLIKQKKEDFELLKRDFNLIQEYPYNR